MRNVSLPNSFFELIAEQLQGGQTVKIRVQGESMFPFLRSGKDLIQLIPYTGQELPLFSAVFYQWEGRYMVHRIICKKEGILDIRGDGNLARIESIPTDRVIGVLQTIYRNNHEIDTLSGSWFRKGYYWNLLRPIRRILIPLLRLFIK